MIALEINFRVLLQIINYKLQSDARRPSSKTFKKPNQCCQQFLISVKKYKRSTKVLMKKGVKTFESNIMAKIFPI